MFQNITNRTKKRNTNSKQNDEYQRLNELEKWCVSVDVLHDFHEKIKKIKSMPNFWQMNCDVIKIACRQSSDGAFPLNEKCMTRRISHQMLLGDESHWNREEYSLFVSQINEILVHFFNKKNSDWKIIKAQITNHTQTHNEILHDNQMKLQFHSIN